jgi:hypothetical protein
MADSSSSLPVSLVTALGDEPLAPLVLARHVRAGRVVCVGRPAVGWRVEPLLAILRREGRRATWLPLDAADVPVGLAALLERLPASDDETLVFDLTNAHGVVGFALYELARRREREHPTRSRMIRVDWSDRLVRAVHPDRPDAELLAVRVPLGEFLELHGKRLLGVKRAQGSRGVYGRAAYRIAASPAAARPLLEAVHRGEWEKPLPLGPREGADELLDGLIEDGVLRREAAATVRAADPRAFQFLHGRWLEEYLFEVADASGRFDDCASGVRFSWSIDGDTRAGRDGAVANEIDFAGTANGRATVASCKTGFREVSAPLYELLTLAERAAGRSVVTVFATSDTLDRSAGHRASALGIRVLDAERLADPERVVDALLGSREPGVGSREAEPEAQRGRA